MEYEYSGSEEEDDGMNEDEGEPRYVFIHVLYLNFKRPFLLNRTFNKETEPEIFLELGQVALGLICLINSVLYSGVQAQRAKTLY